MENGIQISDTMAQVLLGASTVGDHRELSVGYGEFHRTIEALKSRGLVVKESTGRLSTAHRFRLTGTGEILRAHLVRDSSIRSWIAAGLETERVSDQMSEPKREAYRAALTGGQVHKPVPPVPAKDVTEHIKGFHVKLWYKSGSMERIADLEFMTAASLYSEGEDNPRVCAGEVHDSRGMLVASFERCQDPVEALQRHTPATCGRRAVRWVELAYDGKALVCVRVAGHRGLHRNTKTYGVDGVIQWDDNECTPLDTPQERG